MILLDFNVHNIPLSENEDGFTSSFSIPIPSIYFSCLIALVRTSSIMLKRSGDNEYSWHVPNVV